MPGALKLMPIYEYQCQDCQKQFEFILLPSSPTPPQCPACGSKKLSQELSAFAVNSAEKSASSWKKARKAYEKGELRDKKVAEAEAVHHHLHEH